MALTATLHSFDVTLSLVDRALYESISFKAARHPSESEDYLLTRVLAYCLEYTEGIAFSHGGISDPDDPPLMVKDLTGAWRSWIEIGAPDAARLHRASKASPRVALYTHKEPRTLLRSYEGQRIHRADAVEVHAFDRDFLGTVAGTLDRRNRWTLSATDGVLYLDVAGETISGAVEALSLPV